MSNKTYDTLKYIVTIVMPAFLVFYQVVAGVWKIPYTEAVTATIAAATTFLGAVIGVSSRRYAASDSPDDDAGKSGEETKEG